jgi:hypothetical protein
MLVERRRFAWVIGLCIWAFMLCSNSSWSQTVEPQKHWEKLNNMILELCPDIQYSFQVQVSDLVRAYPSIPGNLCDLVTNNRKATQTHFHYISELVRIKIYSEKELNEIKALGTRNKPLIHTSF